MAVDDPRLRDAVIPTPVLAGVVELGERHAVPIGRWFAGTGLTADRIVSQDAAVSFRQATTILHRALRALPAGPIGMQVGGRDILLTFGMVGFAMRSCDTVAEALGIGIELHQASGSLLDVEAEVFGDDLALRFHERAPDPSLLPFLCEEAMTSTLLLARTLVDQQLAPSRLQFNYPQPDYAHAYRQFFRCPIDFDADANRITFPAGLLQQNIPTHNAAARAAAVRACRHLLDPGDACTDVVSAVESLLRDNLRRSLTIAATAARLHMTERTLRRKLTDAGEQFSTVRDRVRHRRADLLLCESHLPIADIAAEVGFSDAREFRRAYIRWTGQPPSHTRSTVGQPAPR